MGWWERDEGGKECDGEREMKEGESGMVGERNKMKEGERKR